MHYLMTGLGLGTDARVTTFDDVGIEDSYAGELALAYDLGFILGKGDHLFGPDDIVTREAIMTIVNRVLDTYDFNNSSLMDITSYTDYDEISIWAIESIEAVLNLEIIVGTSETTLSPLKEITYAEAFQVIYNLLKNTELIN